MILVISSEVKNDYGLSASPFPSSGNFSIDSYLSTAKPGIILNRSDSALALVKNKPLVNVSHSPDHR